MATRLTRVERAEANREALLDAARRTFLEQGYHGTTVDAVAREAGFTIGAVYSRFAGKADLFLALLEQRIEERIAYYRDFPRASAAADDAVTAARWWAGIVSTDLDWALLVIEFRVHAARDPELNRRYAELHERNIRAFAGLVAGRVGEEDAVTFARAAVSMGSGFALARAAEGAAYPDDLFEELAVAVSGRLLAKEDR
jgi:AcrR family transcriptional regulator